MISWHSIPQWCLGANDKWGTCAFAMVGNHVVLLGKGVMSDGEILNAARLIEGLNDQDPSTDRGEAMADLLNYIQANGWPGDETLRISSWSPAPLPELAAVIERRGAAEMWLMLPQGEDGSYDFTDGALFCGANGLYSHAVLGVEANGRQCTFITWGKPVTVSVSWLQAYCRGVFEVVWEDRP